MVGVPELFLERPCFSPISCSDGSLYIHTGRQNYKKITYGTQHKPGFIELPQFDLECSEYLEFSGHPLSAVASG